MTNIKFSSIFPLPPDYPEGKNGPLFFLNPITEMADMEVDFGIVDAALFILHPNESKKWNDAFMSPYNYVNMVDAIELQGAKCNVTWENEIFREIRIIHSEFFTGGVAYRTNYTERYDYDPLVETPIVSIVSIGGRIQPDSIPSGEFEIAAPEISNVITPTVKNIQFDFVKIGPPGNAYTKPCSPVEGTTTAKFPPETRKWIHHLRYIHPLIDKQISKLMLFEPVSEHMGENVITYNSDTNAVDIHDWILPVSTYKNLINPYCSNAFPTAHILREVIRERMIPGEPNMINNAWTKLNSWMHDCMPTEIDLTTSMGIGLWTIGDRDPRKSHGLVYVNDIYHPIDYILPIKIPVADMLFAYLKDSCQLVNHMYQLYNRVKSDDRTIMYSPAFVKNITQNWSIYKTSAPVAGYFQAPIAADFAIGKWGYYGTESITYDWNVGVGLDIEETYPRKKLGSGTFNADLLGNKIKGTITDKIDDKHLEPETELVKPPII